MRFRSLFTNWGRDRSGVGALEFTFIAPLLILVVLGGSELGIALTIDRKVKQAAGTTADLVTQSTDLSETDLQKLFALSKATLAPYSITPLKMRVVQAVVSSDGKAVVDWSCQTTGFDKLAPGTTVDVPPNLVPEAKVSELPSDAIEDANFVDDRDLLILVHKKEKSGNQQNSSPSGGQKQPTVTPTKIYAVYAEAQYEFAPITGRVFDRDVILTGKTFSLPRYSEKVNSGGCSTFGL